MIAVCAAQTNLVRSIIEEQETIGNIEYTYHGCVGLILIYAHNGRDDDEARDVLKGFLKKEPQLKGKLVTVKECDENGTFI